MEISYRLKKIADLVTIKGNLADIGTDHAYTPIYLYKNQKIKKALACDISKGSIEKAKDNIRKYNLEDVLQIRLANGLDKISKDDEIDTIIIAGMGGMLMIDILERGKDITEEAELILQPQKDIDKVRRYLHNNGFYIEYDEMLKDDGKYYNVIKAKKGKEDFDYDEKHYIFGRFDIENKNPLLKEYIKQNLYKMEDVFKNIDSEDKTNLKIYKDIELHKEVLKCL